MGAARNAQKDRTESTWLSVTMLMVGGPNLSGKPDSLVIVPVM